MDMVFLLSVLAVPGTAFCLLLSSNGKVPKITGVPLASPDPRVLLFIAMLCNQANLSPLLSGQKWQNSPGETPGSHGYSFPVVRPGRTRGCLLFVTFQQRKVTKDCRGSPGPQGRGWGCSPHTLDAAGGYDGAPPSGPSANAADGAWVNRTLSGICPLRGFPRAIPDR